MYRSWKLGVGRRDKGCREPNKSIVGNGQDRSLQIIMESYVGVLRQYRIILSADTASEVRQLLSQKSADNTGCCKGERRQWRKQRTEAGEAVAECEGLLPPKHDAGTATRHYRAFWQRRCRAAAAGAVLEPLGGNCAVLPKNNRHNLTRRNAAKGCACYFMRGYRSSWSWVGISSAWSGTPVQLPSGSLWLARFSSSMVCRSWWASAGV